MKIDEMSSGVRYTVPWVVYRDRTGQYWVNPQAPVVPESRGTHNQKIEIRSDGIHTWGQPGTYHTVSKVETGVPVTFHDTTPLTPADDRPTHATIQARVDALAGMQAQNQRLLEKIAKAIGGIAAEPDEPVRKLAFAAPSTPKALRPEHPEIYRRWQRLLRPLREIRYIEDDWQRLKDDQKAFWRQLEENGQ